MQDPFPFMPGPVGQNHSAIVEDQPKSNILRNAVLIIGGLVLFLIALSYFGLALMAASDDASMRSYASHVPGCAWLGRFLPKLHIDQQNLFYDPEQLHSFATSSEERFDSREEAYAAWAREFGRPRKWVELNVGESNNYITMRENLMVATGDYHPDNPQKIITDGKAAAQRASEQRRDRFQAYANERVGQLKNDGEELKTKYAGQMARARTTAERARIARDYADELHNRADDAVHDVTSEMHDSMHNEINDLEGRERKAMEDYRRSGGH